MRYFVLCANLLDCKIMRIKVISMGLIPCAVFLILIFHFTAFSPYGWTDFPLDDAWIHQVYSRSIAHGDGFQYNDGEQEAGSSSPLWSILTAPAHWLGGVFRHRWYGCSGKMRWGMLRYSDLAWDYLDHFCSDGIDAFGNHRGKFFLQWSPGYCSPASVGWR